MLKCAILFISFLLCFLCKFGSICANQVDTSRLYDRPINHIPSANTIPSSNYKPFVSARPPFAIVTPHQLTQFFQERPRQATFYSASFDFFSTWLPWGNNHAMPNMLLRSMAPKNHHQPISSYQSMTLDKINGNKEISLLKILGIDGLNLSLKKDRFFKELSDREGILLWLNYMNSFFYFNTCANKNINTSNTRTAKPTSPYSSNQNLTSLNCNTWVHDLYRPAAPLDSHSDDFSNDTMQAYRNYDNLSKDEKKFFKKRQSQFYLNIIDPSLIKITRFTGPSIIDRAPVLWNVTVRHHLTSFGYAMDTNLYFKQRPSKFLFILRNHFNKKSYFPGIDMKISRLPVLFSNHILRFSTRLAIWLQPENQNYSTSQSELGGLLSFKLSRKGQYTEPYIEMETKTAGWVTGNSHLDPNYRLRVGLSVKIN